MSKFVFWVWSPAVASEFIFVDSCARFYACDFLKFDSVVLAYDPLPQDTPRVIKSLSKSDFQQLEVTHRNINEQKHKWRKNMLGLWFYVQ
jgi:hypothetical protein